MDYADISQLRSRGQNEKYFGKTKMKAGKSNRIICEHTTLDGIDFSFWAHASDNINKGYMGDKTISS